MNIFFLSLIPNEIAEMSCDQHVVKIQLEICQMLYTAWFFSDQQEYVQEHACTEHLIWLRNNHPSHFEERKRVTAFYSKEGIPECMPEEYRCESVVDAYQMYYMVEKMGFARYKFPVDSK